MTEPKKESTLRTVLLGGKPRPLEELQRDPALLYHIGQLQGAAVMVAHWLMRQPDDDSQAMGVRLNEVVNWFFLPPEVKK